MIVERGLAGTILFHVKDDTPVNESSSLTRAIYERQINHMRRPLPRKHLTKRSAHSFSSRRFIEDAGASKSTSPSQALRYHVSHQSARRASELTRKRAQRAPLAQTLTFYVPDASYPPSGARDPQTGIAIRNEELDAKLSLVNVVSYIGLAAQGKQSTTYDTLGGTLYFQNPSNELLSPELDPFCTQDNPICW